MEEAMDLKKALLLLQQQDKEILCIVSQEEKELLQKYSMATVKHESHLSCQHLEYMEQKIGGVKGIRLMVVPQAEGETTAEERGLIYAMLVRCRKVISCRDKLEDMLRHQEPEAWEGVKAEYETRVLDLFKQTWRQVASYPYIIVDNIKIYNTGESYIMRALHNHLAERTPGVKNPEDAAMIAMLKKMFEEISLALIKPEIIILGKNVEAPENLQGKIYRLDV